MRNLNNILLVSGSGRNCGKTTLACHIIGRLSEKGKVFGLKITPHFHLTGKGQQLVEMGAGYKIYKELDAQSGKDTGRMLDAGAYEVFFLQCDDAALSHAFKQLAKVIPHNLPVVCESGSLARIFRPGLHLLVQGTQVDTSKKSYIDNLGKADEIIGQEEFSPTIFRYDIQFSNATWTLNKVNHDQVRRSA